MGFVILFSYDFGNSIYDRFHNVKGFKDISIKFFWGIFVRYISYNLDCISNNSRLNYEFTDGNCYAQKCGACPLENITLEEIKNAQQPNDCVRRNDMLYCLLMAKAMLNGTLHEYMPVSVYHFIKCGHFYIDDGRHRICITEHLQNNGIYYELPIHIYVEKSKCAKCKRNI